MNEGSNTICCPNCRHPLTTRAARNARLGLTAPMRNLLDVTDEFTAKMGHSPTYDQMAFMLGVKSKSNIHRLVKSLAERGWVTYRPQAGFARSIAVAEEARHVG